MINCKEKMASSPLLIKRRDIMEDSWLTTLEVCKLLQVCKKTLQNYRDLGILPFSKIGNKIYYKQSDIQKCLEDHYVNPFSGRRMRS